MLVSIINNITVDIGSIEKYRPNDAIAANKNKVFAIVSLVKYVVNFPNNPLVVHSNCSTIKIIP